MKFNFTKLLLRKLFMVSLVAVPLVAAATPIKSSKVSAVMKDRVAITVTGKVSDSLGNPLVGVSVRVKNNSSIGTATDGSGKYSLQVEADADLIFTYTGFDSYETAVAGRKQIDVVLKMRKTEINEVVVIGYSSKQLSQVSSSIDVVSGEKLNDVTSNDITSLLQGKAAGVIVSNSSAGDPAGSPSIIIRGSSSISAGSGPLYVVDGIIGGTANPSDVESVTILKDAAATGLYGSRAANGVIIVTTKSGKPGKTRITLNSAIGFNNVSYGKFRMMNNEELYAYEKTFFPADILAGDRPDSILSQNTNWKDLAYRTGVTQNYTLTVSGGSEKTRVYVAGNYYNEQGTMRTTGNEKYNLRTNVSHDINSKITLNVKLDASFRKYSRDASGHYGAYNSAIVNIPFDNPFNPDGTIKMGTEPGWIGREHDNFLQGWQYNYDEVKVGAVAGDMDLIYHIIPHLTFSSYNRASYRNSKGVVYYDVRSKPGGGTNGRLENDFSTNSGLITSNRLQYENSFGSHNISLLAVGEAEKNYSDDNNVIGQGLPPALSVMDIASTILDAGGNTNENAFSKGLIQADYNYANRYFLVASFINESSSRFGSNNRSANFYTLAGSWNLTNENFMRDQHMFDLLKIRLSYGATGNAQIGDYQTLGLYSYSYQYGGFSAAIPSQLENSDLTWEKAKTTNLGFDIGLWRRILINVDLYDKTTNALLLNVPLPYTSGFESVFQNVGSVRNRGLEISLNTENLTGEFKWNTGFNIAFNRNKVLELYKGQDILSTYQNISVGHDLFSWYMRKWAGVDPENGDPLWEKVAVDDNGKKTVSTTNSYSDATLQFVGTGSPDFTGGISNDFSYKGFSLNVFFNFVSGNLIYSGEGHNSDGAYETNNSSILPEGRTRWEKPGDIATEPKAVYGGNLLSNKPSSRYLEDGSYIRLRNISLGYQLPSSFLSKFRITSAKLYVSGDNLWTGTSFPGRDPEVDLVPGGGLQEGSGATTYPISKKILFGINLEF